MAASQALDMLRVSGLAEHYHRGRRRQPLHAGQQRFQVADTISVARIEIELGNYRRRRGSA